MKTIIDKITGEVLYASAIEVFLLDNEIEITELVVDNFDNPYFDFETRTFYNKVTI